MATTRTCESQVVRTGWPLGSLTLLAELMLTLAAGATVAAPAPSPDAAVAASSPASAAERSPPAASGPPAVVSSPPPVVHPPAPSATGGDPRLCSSDRNTAIAAFVSGEALPASPAGKRLAGLWQFLPSNGVTQLYLWDKYRSNEPTRYRVFVAKSPLNVGDSSSVLQLAMNDAVLAEEAPRQQTADLKVDAADRTLVQFESSPRNTDESWTWGRLKARVTVIGCTSIDKPPVVFGAMDTKISSTGWSGTIAIVLAVVFYFIAAFAAFYTRRRNRSVKSLPNGFSDFFVFGAAHRKAVGNWKGKPITGTNYASFWTHLDPVVLTAGPNGKGSPTKLQILFFSIVVFGVMSYIFMLTGHLISLSTKILLLLGISGVGAVAAGGAEMAKNRLSFENYAWLIKNKWLPEGGIAEENLAEWKDIFTNEGEFDVTRFQMVIFSFMVAASLIGFAYRVNDLTDFDISDALLGLLGLSQVLFVSGKLIAPPSMKDLDTKLNELQAAEKALRDARDKAGLAGVAFIFGAKNQDVVDAAKAYTDYKSLWTTAREMFESSLGRDVPQEAETFCPPFTMAQVTDNEVIRLSAVEPDKPFSVQLLAIGGSGQYQWQVGNSKAPWIAFAQQAPTGPTVDVTGTAPAEGTFAFSVTASDGTSTKVRSFSIEAVGKR